MSDETPTVDRHRSRAEPHIQILKGRPTDAELAALITVLSTPAARRNPPSRRAPAGGYRSTGCVLRCPTYQRLTTATDHAFMQR